MAVVRLEGVRKAFGSVEVIKDVNLQVRDGEFCCFVGPSGCGKSTLLRLIAGLEEPSGGDLFIGGRRVNDMAPSERGVAMVFQSYALYPHMTAFDNMAFGLKMSRLDRGSVRERVEDAARMLQIEKLLDRLPRQLSGGQRQRVAIGRAVVRQPEVFLFDEPLSNLDAALRAQTRVELANLHARLGSTMIYVTHDQVEAMTLADRIVVLNEGRVEQVGAPLDLYHEPANTFVAGFIGAPRMNFIDVTLEAFAAGHAVLRLPSGATMRAAADASNALREDRMTLGVRPEHVRLANGSDSPLSGEVVFSENLGDHGLVYLRMDGVSGLVTAKVAPDDDTKRGQFVGLDVRSAHCHLFDARGTACPRIWLAAKPV